MPISTNSLIHFTSNKNNLKGIISHGFQVANCREKIILGRKIYDLVIPMVSFCDIPLSEIKSHVENYGRYGIGLTKEWGKKNFLNPVLYMSSDSHLSSELSSILVNSVFGVAKKNSELNGDQKSLLNVVRFIKNYEESLTRKGITIDNYRFYDEREWRYVPKVGDLERMLVSFSSYEKNKDKINEPINNIRLNFSPKDIKYIIIDNDEEISEFINHIREATADTCTMRDIERLTTRIFTTEQIMTDI